MVEASQKVARKTLRASSLPLEQAMVALKVNNVEMSKRLGVSENIISHWRTTKQMSELAAVACRGLLAASKKPGSDKFCLLVSLVSADKCQTIRDVLQTLGASTQKMDMP